MSTSYESTGRTRQKARTRAALLEATRRLLAEGITPTVEQAADRAAISRTTAYRYFTNQRELLIAAYPVIDLSAMLTEAAPADVRGRLGILVDRFTASVIAHEPELRAMLRLSLETPRPAAELMPLRQGRGIAWIEHALAPLRGRVSSEEFRRLVFAVRAAIGIEALVWLCDVAHLSREEALAVMKWSAGALLDRALGEARRRRLRKRNK